MDIAKHDAGQSHVLGDELPGDKADSAYEPKNPKAALALACQQEEKQTVEAAQKQRDNQGGGHATSSLNLDFKVR